MTPLAVDPAPGPAREWLREELSRSDYQPTLTERFFGWVGDLFDGVRSASSAVGGFDPVVAVVVLVVLVVLAAVVLSRLRRNPRAAVGAAAVFADARLTAQAHRDLAQRALDREEWDAAVVESTRALAAGLLERGLLVEEPGATAHEIAGRAAETFPSLRERLLAVAAGFDETLYGDHPADAHRAREAAALEQTVADSTPERSGSDARRRFPAVPR